MAADIAKGAVASRIGRRLAGDIGQHVAGVAAVVGHCYPVTKDFRGGKGVGCSVGQCLATFPAYLPIDVAVAAAVAMWVWWRMVAIGDPPRVGWRHAGCMLPGREPEANPMASRPV